MVRPGRSPRAGRRHPGRPGPVPQGLGPGPPVRGRRRAPRRPLVTQLPFGG
ncbi:MAG TPA: hypothetical protein VFE55_22225 [Acidimicrobiia bacterium]|nr:hypothetical protein [Acidimicrobiia bacterium]